jgi:FSR family fosmidomycin resistance protein-like MFS transporter
MTEIADDVVLQDRALPYATPTVTAATAATTTTMGVLWALSLSHMLNDTMQALIPAMYPVIKTTYGLSFSDVGLITLVFQMAGSVLQPVVGTLMDRRPLPYSLAGGMGLTLVGLLLLSAAGSFSHILLATALVGTGSAVFHPEASRLARLAAGRRHGLAQSVFQVGGNFGSSLGPLLAAWIVVPRGQRSLAWFAVLALVGMAVLTAVGRWYGRQIAAGHHKTRAKPLHALNLSRRRTALAMGVLVVLIISKFFYLICLSNYYTFYLIHKFGVSVQASQVYLFVFLFAVAAGTIAGGPLGDRFGRRAIIWVSILGVAPFSIALPHVGLAMTAVLSVCEGLILASAFPAIIVFAQELAPARVGLVAGLFFGFAFGVSGIASAALGALADRTSIEFVFKVCGFLPLLGLLTALLPNVNNRRAQGETVSPSSAPSTGHDRSRSC